MHDRPFNYVHGCSYRDEPSSITSDSVIPIGEINDAESIVEIRQGRIDLLCLANECFCLGGKVFAIHEMRGEQSRLGTLGRNTVELSERVSGLVGFLAVDVAHRERISQIRIVRLPTECRSAQRRGLFGSVAEVVGKSRCSTV